MPVSKIKLSTPVILPKNSTCKDAETILSAEKFNQIPMKDDEGNIKGFITREKLLSSLISGELKVTDPAEKALIKQFRKVTTATTLGRLSRMLQKDRYAVVLDENNHGALVGIVTQIDLMDFIYNN